MKKSKIVLISLLIIALLLTGCKANNTALKPVEEYEKEYPDKVKMFKSNSEMSLTKFGGSEQVDYLAKYPYLKNFYEGYGFAKQYDRARGHVYAVEDVLSTTRPKKGASCLACKTSEFNEALLKDKNVSAANFEEFAKEHVKVGFTCYDCHGEKPGEINVKRVHIVEGLKEEKLKGKIEGNALACAQCHTEYYMTNEDNAVKLPWTNGLGCEEAFAYYEKDGFFDWEHPKTGAKLLKAQHPEVETFDGSLHAGMNLTCSDCHMPEVEFEGKKVSSHHWTSPLKNDVENACLKCHSDQTEDTLIKAVEGIQAKVTDKTDQVALKLDDFIKKLSEKRESGNLEGTKLEDLQHVHREAQFYWDYVFVENGEGFHNTEKQMKYLEHAEELLEKALSEL